VFGLALGLPGPGRAQEDAGVRALLDRAIKAHGGEAQLKRFKAYTANLKGTIHIQGMDIPFTGEIATQGDRQQRIIIEFAVGNEKFRVTHVLNGDRGWVKLNDDLKAMNKDELVEARHQAYADSLTRLVPLRDKGFTLAPLGETKVEGRRALGVRVSRKGQRDVNLYFDGKTSLLVKMESRVKDEQSGQEVTDEALLSGHDEKGTRQALRITIRRDSEPYLQAEISDYREEESLDVGTFAKP
jgi:hypothetical protein